MRTASIAMELAGCPSAEIDEFEQRYQIWMYQTLSEMGEAFNEDVAAARSAQKEIKRKLEVAATA